MSLRTLIVGAALAMPLFPSPAGATPPAALSEAAALSAGVKVGVAEHVANWLAWPPPAEPSVIGAPTDYAGTWVQRIDLYGGGQIQITLKPNAGGGHVQLRPQNDDPNAQPIQWSCESPDILDVGQLSGCVFTGIPFGPEAQALAAGPKTSIAEYRNNFGTWPAPGDPLVVDAPTSYAGTYVARIDLAANGVLIVTLRANAGGGHIALTPDQVNFGAITWACTSADIAAIASLMPGCSFTP